MKVQFLNSNSIELLERLIIVNALLICSVGQQAFAGTMHVFKDKDGQVLLTNVITEDKKPAGNNFTGFDRMVASVYYEDDEYQSTNRDSYQEFLRNLKFIGIIQNNIKIYQGITPRGNAIYFDGSKQFGQLTGFVVDEIIKNKNTLLLIRSLYKNTSYKNLLSL